MEALGLMKELGRTAVGPRHAVHGRVVQARFLGYLFAAGATLGGLGLVAPHPAEMNEVGILALVAIAYAVAVLALVPRKGFAPPAVIATLALGTTLISLAIHFTGTRSSPYGFFYIWVALYAFYFLSWREAAALVAFIGLAYALVPLDDHLLWWLITLGTLTTTGGLILLIRVHLDRLIQHLEGLAREDALTGLMNRRGFRELLDLELERARRAEAGLSLLIGDLDHFKHVNDRCGHETGDAALRRVAAVLTGEKRATDIAARIGGEEFALLMPGIDASDSFEAAERLRRAVQREFEDDPVPLSISFGLATFPCHGQTAGRLMRAADDALYAAKESGRDRTVVRAANQPVRGAGRAGQVHGERFLATVLELAEVVDLRFSGSARHSETVGRYAEIVARELGMPRERVDRMRLAGVLHDIGKVCVPCSILRKPGRLTEPEWEEIKRHPELGAGILDHDSLADVRAWVLAHHERPDGKGYPYGLRGEQIALEARIIAVADAYEAMTADRDYAPAMTHDEAAAELLEGAGSQFDVGVVSAFFRGIGRDLPEPSTSVTLGPVAA